LQKSCNAARKTHEYKLETVKKPNLKKKEITLMKIKILRLVPLLLVCLLGGPAWAVNPGPTQVSSLFVPIEGDITEPGTTNTVHLTGEVHVLTHVTFSDDGVPSVGIWANLVRVRGTSSATGITYLGVGADNGSWVGVQPGPINIPEQEFSFALISLEISPGPIQLPVFLRNFVFGADGELQTVEASFMSG
jgi:hypothetical protein